MREAAGRSGARCSGCATRRRPPAAAAASPTPTPTPLRSAPGLTITPPSSQAADGSITSETRKHLPVLNHWKREYKIETVLVGIKNAFNKSEYKKLKQPSESEVYFQ